MFYVEIKPIKAVPVWALFAPEVAVMVPLPAAFGA
jgi:hypothetical protein